MFVRSKDERARKVLPSPTGQTARLSKAVKSGWQRSTLPARGVNALKKMANALVLTLIMVSVVVIDVVATLMHALCRLFGGRSMRDVGHHAP